MTSGEQPGFWRGLAEIYSQMSAVRRREFYLVLALMLLNAVAELGTIGAVLPLLSLLADPSGLGHFPWAIRLLESAGADSVPERLVAATAVFCAFAIVAGVVRLQLARKTQDFSFRLEHELMVEVQRRLLLQPYSFHIQRSTSTLISAVDKIEILVFSVLLPLMQAVIAAFLSGVIVAALIYIDPFTALVAAAAFSAIYLAVSAIARQRLGINSAVVARGYDERLRILQESLGGIRDVIIDQSHGMYLRLFDEEAGRLNRARANTTFIASAPRYVIEAIGMVIIAGLALVTSQREGGIAGALPILGALALGAQRLLPLVQQIYHSWSTAAGHLSVVEQIVELLQLRAPEEDAAKARVKPLPLNDTIRIDKVSFTYPTRLRPAIEEVTLEIPRGSTLAVIGETGSGKSTLADLLMGLLEPDEGRICVDGVPLTGKNRRRWQRSIAHVPQAIFLTDASIASNIALGSEGLDHSRVEEAASNAQLHEFITSLSDGYDTLVGENGIRLSGGQRQRLGIARAIYKGTPVLVLDEATSALDEATEAAVIDSLDQLGSEGRTTIIISHRPSVVARCDMMARLRDGRLVELGPPNVIGAAVRS